MRNIAKDPFAFIIAFFMAMVLFLWLSSSNTALNPIGGNSTVTAQFTKLSGNCGSGIGGSCAPGQTPGLQWLAELMFPLAIPIAIKSWIDIEKSKVAVAGEETDIDEGEEE